MNILAAPAETLRPPSFEIPFWRELTRRHHSLEEIFVHLTRTKKEAE